MMNEQDLLTLCKRIVDKGKALGATAIEVQAQHSQDLDASIELSQVSSVSLSKGAEIAIRVFSGKRVGSAFTNVPSESEAIKALELALSAARATTEDKDLQSLPESKKYPAVEGLWDPKALDLDPSIVAEISTSLVERCSSEEPGLIAGYGGTGISAGFTAYANSNGIEHAERGSTAYTYVMGVAPTDTGMTPGVTSFDIKRGPDLDVDRVVSEVVDTIRIVKQEEKGKSGAFDMVFHPSAYGQIMMFTLFQSIRGDNVARGKSKIGDKIGEEIASDSVTITDDGLDPRGIYSSIADDEGVPRQRTPVIESGILRSFLWDNYWARRMGVESTGNARRDRRQGTIEVAPSNIVVEQGTRTVEKIISEMEFGYYIRNVQGAHSSNPESGDFSIVGNPAILVKNGELVGAVHGLMISGNIFDLLKQVVEVAQEPRNMQFLIAPDILCSDVTVIAR